MAYRLTAIIPSLISHHQAAFFKGRSILDHIAMAHKLTQKLNQRLSGGSLCLKLDISKAFYRLDWAFLLKALHHFGFFDSNWIVLIKECICGSRGSILINGEATGFFPVECRLRQVDPLSPYLFILAEEILSLNISNLVSRGDLIPIFQPASCRLLQKTIWLEI